MSNAPPTPPRDGKTAVIGSATSASATCTSATLTSATLTSATLTNNVNILRDAYGFEVAEPELYTRHRRQHYERSLARQEHRWEQLLLARKSADRLPPRSKQVKQLVRAGIPRWLRGQAWYEYSGAIQRHREHPDVWPKLNAVLADDADRTATGPKSPGRVSPACCEESCLDAIERDLLRTFPENIHFSLAEDNSLSENQHGLYDARVLDLATLPPLLKRLRHLLLAFALYRPDIGYCQSLNYIVAIMLLFLDDDAQVFWLLATLVEDVLPADTYTASLMGAKVDQDVLWWLVLDKYPAIRRKLPEGCEVAAMTTAWLLKLYVDVLPVETMLRVWDCLFYEGSKVLFRAALAIVKYCEPAILATENHLDIFMILRDAPKLLYDCDDFMDICFRRVGGAAGKFPMAMIEAKRREFLDAEELTTVQGNNEISHADKERGHFGVDHHHHRDLSQIMGNAASRFFAAVMPSTTSATPRRGRFGSRWSSDTAASSSDASPTHHYQQTRPSSRANKQRELQMLAVDALSATSDSELDSGNDEHEDTANVVIAISSSTTAATLAATATNTTNNTATSNAPPTPDSMVEMMDMLKLSPLTTSAPTAPSSLQAGRSRRGTATTATTAAYVRAVPSTVQVGEEQTKQGL